jgi:hypothetical protein
MRRVDLKTMPRLFFALEPALIVLVAFGLSSCTKAKLLGSRILGSIQINSVIPPSGPITGGTHLLLNGTNFQNGMQVVIGGFVCTDVVILSSTQANCVTSESTEAGFLPVIGIAQSGSSNANIEYEYIQVVTNNRVQITSGGTVFTTAGSFSPTWDGGSGAPMALSASSGVRGPLSTDLEATGETSYVMGPTGVTGTTGSIYSLPGVQGAFHYYLSGN